MLTLQEKCVLYDRVRIFLNAKGCKITTTQLRHSFADPAYALALYPRLPWCDLVERLRGRTEYRWMVAPWCAMG